MMRAATIHGARDLRLQEVPEPELLEPTDAILRVTHSAICGSDLHLYHDRVPGIEYGMTCGHEFAGEVAAVGEAVRDVEVGRQYVASMFTACGQCAACLRLEHRSCMYFGMFGYGIAFGDLQGGQADYVRVPFADMTLIEKPEGVETNDLLLLSDILPTAWAALERGGVRAGDTVAVVGAGPLGQLIMMCAPLFGAAQVIAIDVDASRLAQAEEIGALAVNADEGDPLDGVFDLTVNRGADVAIEAAGNAGALKTAMEVARVAGRVAMVGVLVDEPFPMSAGEVFVRGLTLQPLLGEPLRYAEPLTKLITSGRIDPGHVISHELPLDDVEKAYEIFEQRQATKIVLRP